MEQAILELSKVAKHDVCVVPYCLKSSNRAHTEALYTGIQCESACARERAALRPLTRPIFFVSFCDLENEACGCLGRGKAPSGVLYAVCVSWEERHDPKHSDRGRDKV